jgi:hypothetical protein
VTLVKRKNSFAVLAKVCNKSANLVGWTFDAKLNPLNSQAKALSIDNGKEFEDDQAMAI